MTSIQVFTITISTYNYFYRNYFPKNILWPIISWVAGVPSLGVIGWSKPSNNDLAGSGWTLAQHHWTDKTWRHLKYSASFIPLRSLRIVSYAEQRADSHFYRFFCKKLEFLNSLEFPQQYFMWFTSSGTLSCWITSELSFFRFRFLFGFRFAFLLLLEKCTATNGKTDVSVLSFNMEQHISGFVILSIDRCLFHFLISFFLLSLNFAMQFWTHCATETIVFVSLLYSKVK